MPPPSSLGGDLVPVGVAPKQRRTGRGGTTAHAPLLGHDMVPVPVAKPPRWRSALSDSDSSGDVDVDEDVRAPPTDGERPVQADAPQTEREIFEASLARRMAALEAADAAEAAEAALRPGPDGLVPRRPLTLLGAEGHSQWRTRAALGGIAGFGAADAESGGSAGQSGRAGADAAASATEGSSSGCRPADSAWQERRAWGRYEHQRALGERAAAETRVNNELRRVERSEYGMRLPPAPAAELRPPYATG